MDYVNKIQERNQVLKETFTILKKSLMNWEKQIQDSNDGNDDPEQIQMFLI